MIFKIHFTYIDGTEDWFVVSGGGADEMRAKAERFLKSRDIAPSNPQSNCWSEEAA